MGQSSGEYRDACVSRWSRDTVAIIDWLASEHAHSGAILVGAGVGGWVMLHAAKSRPEAVKGLVRAAPARAASVPAFLPLLPRVAVFLYGWRRRRVLHQ